MENMIENYQKNILKNNSIFKEGFNLIIKVIKQNKKFKTKKNN
jgi:hypothetical protein